MTLTKPNKKYAHIFCGHCSRVCEYWSMNLAMYKHYKRHELYIVTKYQKQPEGKFLQYYFEMSQLATLLETAKLHDEAKDKQGHENLSIEFFARHEYWQNAEEEWRVVKRIKANLHNIYQESGIIQSRNKMFCHLSREFIDNHDDIIYEIPCSEIDNYLELLGQLAQAIAIKWNCDIQTSDFDWSPDGVARKSYCERANYIIQDKLCPTVIQNNPA